MGLSKENSTNNPRKRRSSAVHEKPADTFSDAKIRVGEEFQAQLPDCVPIRERELYDYPESSTLVWSPASDISDAKLNQFADLAKEKYCYSEDEALEVLNRHTKNFEAAMEDLPNFAPIQDKWLPENEILFKEACRLHWDNFNKIQERLVPHRTIGSIMKHYYSSRNLEDAMDEEIAKIAKRRKRQSRKNSQPETSTDEKISRSQETSPSDTKSQQSAVNAIWTDDELFLAIEGIYRHGKDFPAIAKDVGTKTEVHVRSFFLVYRRKYNLDALLKKREAENVIALVDDSDKKKMTPTTKKRTFGVLKPANRI